MCTIHLCVCHIVSTKNAPHLDTFQSITTCGGWGLLPSSPGPAHCCLGDAAPERPLLGAPPGGEGLHGHRSLLCFRLRPFTSYKLRLKATNDIGDSDFSAETEAVTTLQDGEQRAHFRCCLCTPKPGFLERPAPTLNQEGVTQGSRGATMGSGVQLAAEAGAPAQLRAVNQTSRASKWRDVSLISFQTR